MIAIDADEWSINNAKENFVANNCTDIVLLQKDNLNNLEIFDIILANINLNVINNSIKSFKTTSHKCSEILISGFLKQDKKNLINNFISKGFKYVRTMENNTWLSSLLMKS